VSEQQTDSILDWPADASEDTLQTLFALLYRPDNVYEAVSQVRPFGIDVCSGVRTDGKLDPVKLQALIDQGTKILDRDIPSIVFTSAFIPVAWWDNVKGHGTATKGVNFWEGMRNEIWWLDK
jgi:hypothetical protein